VTHAIVNNAARTACLGAEAKPLNTSNAATELKTKGAIIITL